MWSTVQNAWYGISLGSVLLLAAIGLAITFGVMGVINMAHGEMVMIGAYTTFVVQEVIRTRYPGLFDYSPEDTEIKRIYMERAKRVVVLCDAQKFGHHSMVQVAPLTAFHVLVVDRPPPAGLAAALASAGVQILQA